LETARAIIVELDTAASVPSTAKRTRQGRLLRKYAIVVGALVGGALVLGSVIQLSFTYQESQAAILGKQTVEASKAALKISQFVDNMTRRSRADIHRPASATGRSTSGAPSSSICSGER